MQIHQEHSKVKRSNVTDEHAFTIKASAKAFAVLTNNLYSDKPLAIIRELACNAYDSHVAAGKKDVPIEVVLPTRMNPQLSIKDTGLGLDHEGMIDIYTKFFESTKTESDDFVGQLGLGSKSPFSMFKTFSVEARKDGVKRVYTAFLNEVGVPSISKMGEEDTTEANGVIVTMAVKPDDINTFHKAAERALLYFNPRPIVNGDPNFIKEIDNSKKICGTNWVLRGDDFACGTKLVGPYVVQGAVMYPVDMNIVKEHHVMTQSEVAVCTLNLDFIMPIGSVDIAPSREALSYDKRTIEAIFAAVKVAAREIRTPYQAAFDKCKTAYEAGILFNQYENHSNYNERRVFEQMHKETPFTWNGQKVTCEYTLDVAKIHYTTFTKFHVSGKTLKKDFQFLPTTLVVDRKVTLRKGIAVLVDNNVKHSREIIKQYINNRANGISSVLVLKPVDKQSYDKAEIDGIIKMLGNVPVVDVATIPYTPDARKCAYRARGKEERLHFIGFQKKKNDRHGDLNRTFSRLTWETVSVDLEEGGFYVPIERFSIVHNGTTQVHFDQILAAAIALGVITQSDADQTYGFNEKEIAKLKGSKKWKNLFDYIKKQYAKTNVTQRIVDEYAVDKLDGEMSSFLGSVIGKNWKTYKANFDDGMFKSFINKVFDMGVGTKKDYSYVNLWQQATPLLRIAADSSAIEKMCSGSATALINEYRETLRAYALLKLIQWQWITREDTQPIIEYINSVNVKVK